MKSAFIVSLALLVVSSNAIGIDKPSGLTEDVILRSPEVTNFGGWHAWEYCPLGTYVVGMQLKTERYGGVFYDDTSLNGVKLYCAAVGYRHTNVTVKSGINVRGSFRNSFFCEGVATGFQLKSEAYQTVFADDTAGNNLRFYCNNQGNKLIEGDGEGFGDWTRAQHCYNKQALCGVQTQVEMEHGNGDETGLNNIAMKCCDVPDPADECDPEDDWELLIECDNMEAVTPTTCTYERKVGISHSTTQSESHYELGEIYSNIGFSLVHAIPGLNINFGFNLGTSHKTGHNWTMTNSEVWNVETKTTVSFDVPPKVSTQLLQTVGNCGIYNVATQRVKRIDTEAETNKTTITFITI